MIARVKPIVVVAAGGEIDDRRGSASLKRPLPVTTVTFLIFAICARPPVSLPTTLFLCATSFAGSTFGAPNSTPTAPKCATSSITAATCSIAFDGMQPTLRQTPPSVL